MRNLLNVTAHMLGQASGSNSARPNQSCTKRARHDTNIGRSSYSKGVIALLSGNWAAQVYVNHNWILLGIFKTEKEAVMSYESTTIKLWIERLNRYLQRISNAAQEPNVQKQASIDSTRNIQKQASIDGTESSISVNSPQVYEKQKCIRTRLFEKILTRSDVSKLNRIVIPKTHACYFPCINKGNESSSEIRPVNDVELAFYDQSMKQWKFRYCYWKSSDTYVFSRGWINFVRDKQLSSKDKVIFFKCELVEATYFVIDVEYNANRVQVEEVGGNMEENVVSSREKFHSVQNLDNEQNGGETADKELEGSESGKAPETGFKLFGVKIA